LKPAAGEHVLDIGSGSGHLAYDIAATVGRTGHVCGIDASSADKASSSSVLTGVRRG
jgi:ubiquinone/menaquinone biosynthesis C-methylase UbiE